MTNTEQKTQSPEMTTYIQMLLSAQDAQSFAQALRVYILIRLKLPEKIREASLYGLVVYSVKLRVPGIDAKRLEERLATTDCHQTSYVVSKKNLLMMEIEKMIGVHLTPETLDHIETTDDYAAALWEAKTCE